MRLHLLAGAFCGLLVVTTLGAHAAPPTNVGKTAYDQTNLVSNIGGHALNQDDDLVNSWGLAFGPGPAWVADNGTGKSTMYNGLGAKSALVVTIPAAVAGQDGVPTGIVFNGTSGFVVQGAVSGPSHFLFATEDGTISGWPGGATAIIAVNTNNQPSPAIYKGLAIAKRGQETVLYATDFHNRKIDVFDSSFNPVMIPGAFQDPDLPPRYAPFGIQAISDKVYVTYALQDEEAEDDVARSAAGFVDVYDTSGTLIQRLVSRGKLNAPWGLALAPGDFGMFSDRLLVGNFGDGTINAYDIQTGHYEGTLKGPDHHALRIDGLWGLQFGNDAMDQHQPHNTLFFAAGPNGETEGLFGRIDVVSDDD